VGKVILNPKASKADLKVNLCHPSFREFYILRVGSKPVVILNRLPLYLKSRWIIPRLTLIGIKFGPQVMILAFNPCFDSCPKENAFAAWPCWPAEVNTFDQLTVSYQLFNRTPRKWDALSKRFKIEIFFCHCRPKRQPKRETLVAGKSYPMAATLERFPAATRFGFLPSAASRALRSK
jgi:hypothetical protein